MSLILLLAAVAVIPAASRMVRALITMISQLIAVAIVVGMAFAFLLAMSGNLRLW